MIIPPMDNCQLLAVSSIGSPFVKINVKNWIYCGSVQGTNIVPGKQLSELLWVFLNGLQWAQSFQAFLLVFQEIPRVVYKDVMKDDFQDGIFILQHWRLDCTLSIQDTLDIFMMQVVFQLLVCFGISNPKDRNLAIKLCFDGTALSDVMSLNNTTLVTVRLVTPRHSRLVIRYQLNMRIAWIIFCFKSWSGMSSKRFRQPFEGNWWKISLVTCTAWYVKRFWQS